MPAASTPAEVVAAHQRATDLGFSLSCEPPTGPTLAALAAGVRRGGRILEIGTGAGVGTAWIVSGLTGRTDVEVVTVELDEQLAAAVRQSELPVEVLHGDAVKLLATLGQFDFIFADAEGGKWSGLDVTLNALAPGGVLLVDDMNLTRYQAAEHREAVTRVRDTLMSDERLVTVELDAGTGLIISTRRID